MLIRIVKTLIIDRSIQGGINTNIMDDLLACWLLMMFLLSKKYVFILTSIATKLSH